MKGYRILVLVLGVLLLLGVTAAPALACDDGCCCCDPKTPGYWKTHADAWPVDTITIGGMTYAKADAIAMLGQVSGDKWSTLFRALVAAELNVADGCDAPGWIDDTMAAAHTWLSLNPKGVAASSCAWKSGECLYLYLDWWNNT